MPDEIQLGTAYRDGYAFAVYAWRRYGVVCPRLCTTNGAASVIARAVQRYEPIVHAEPAPDVDLAAHLRAAYLVAFPDGGDA